MATEWSDALRALLSAARKRAEPGDVAKAAGVLGVLGTTAFCTLGCMCAEKRLFRDRVLRGSERLGLRLEATSSMAAKPSGRPTRTWCFGGDTWTVARVRGFRAHHAETIGGLLDFVADLQHPIVPGECAGGQVIPVGRGLAAYACWEAAMNSCSRLSASRREAIAGHAASWSSMRELASQFLISIAGARRTAWARCLRRAGSLAADEAKALQETLVSGQATVRVSGVVEAIREAASLSRRIHGLVAWATLTASGLDEPVASELLRTDGEPPDLRVTGSLIYLARAASSPFRRLAVARLAFSAEPQARATIRETVNDSNPDVSDVARWAMERRSD